jgi:hypothetical protein
MTEYWRRTYIFELHGKMGMAVMTCWLQNHKPSFMVFQLTRTNDGHDYKWKEVHTLGDCALFLGRTCTSRAVQVQAGEGGVVGKNHIYYSNYRPIPSNEEYKKSDKEVGLAKSENGDNIYCQKDIKFDGHGDGKERISTIGYYITNCSDCPMWCFPPNF